MTFMRNLLPAASTGFEEECRMEKEAELIRRERFLVRFPRIASTPLINRAFGAVHSHGIQYFLFLLVAILVFTAIKVPFLHAPFTGKHSMKYNTYVEPAVYMVQEDDK